MAIRLEEKSALESIPLTPLIDCVFLLLIFFLVATQLTEDERKLDMALPTASEAQPLVTHPSQMIINIDHQGRYFVSGEMIDLAGLFQALRRFQASNPGRASAIIRADKRCRWQHIVAAMNACNQANVHLAGATTFKEET